MKSALRSLFLLGFGLSLAACGKDPEPTPDAGPSVGSVACYVADQFKCDEYPNATTMQHENSAIACSSLSGMLSEPAACPTAEFVGKCTTGTGTDTHVERFYTGVDAAYNQDFCVNTALGVWSTTF